MGKNEAVVKAPSSKQNQASDIFTGGFYEASRNKNRYNTEICTEKGEMPKL